MRPFAISSFLFAILLLSGRADALETMRTNEAVQIVLSVGVPTSPPTGAKVGAASGNVGMHVIGPVVPLRMTLSTRQLMVSGAPGSTIALPCAVKIHITEPTSTFGGGPELFDILGGPGGDFIGSSGTFSGGNLGYSVKLAGQAPSYEFGLTIQTAKTWVSKLTSAGVQDACANLKIRIPANVAPGVYYDVYEIALYDGDAGGGVPTPTPTPTPTATPTATPPPTTCTPGPHLYVSEGGGGQSIVRVDEFDPGTNGNYAPECTITGPLSSPVAVRSDSSGHIFVTDVQSPRTLFVFGQGPNPAAIASTQLPIAAESLAFDGSGNFFISDGVAGIGSTVEKFASGSWSTGGTVVPIATLSVGTTPQLSLPDAIDVAPDGTLYVANYSTQVGCGGVCPPGNILVYPPGANGATVPSAVIGGPTDNIGTPVDVKLDGKGNIYVLTDDSGIGGNSRVYEFAAGANGDAPVVASIQSSYFANASHLWVDASGGIYVVNENLTCCGPFQNAVLYFAPGSNGTNVAPTRVIAGSNTGFDVNEGLHGIGM